MKERLSIFQNLKSPFAWTGAVRSSPAQWKSDDGRAVISALEKARDNPVERPFDEAKLTKVPPVFSAKNLGAVTIPDAASEIEVAPSTKEGKEPTDHDEIQFPLLKLGSDMGLDIWVAKNDRGKQFKGQKFVELPRMLDDLPLQFEEATTNTIKLIDVLWLKGKSIEAAFEIESTTSIYSGLLRMSDLVAMQPNINIPLYIVAPDDRREKVRSEINRPTFSSLSPKMNEACRYLPFNQLRKRIQQAGDLVRYLKPEFLDEVSESCELPDEQYRRAHELTDDAAPSRAFPASGVGQSGCPARVNGAPYERAERSPKIHGVSRAANPEGHTTETHGPALDRVLVSY